MCDVSVIVPLYNTKEYLPSFFACLEKQTFKNFEILIIDDLSTDGSLEYVEEYSNTSKLNIRIIKGVRKMLPDLARKEAFLVCEGKYVISLDSDDEFSDNYLESLFELAQANDLDFAVSSCQRIDEKGSKKGTKRLLSKNDIPIMSPKEKRCLIKGRYGGWNRMAKVEFLKRHKYDYSSAELPLFILQFDESAKVGYTTKSCYFYRARGGSISTSKVPARIADYELLEPLEWRNKITVDPINVKPLGLYLYRMILPYIFYKKAFIKNYDYKKDIRRVKKETQYSFLSVIKYWWYLQKRDRKILFAFVFHLYGIVFLFIRKYRM